MIIIGFKSRADAGNIKSVSFKRRTSTCNQFDYNDYNDN